MDRAARYRRKVLGPSTWFKKERQEEQNMMMNQEGAEPERDQRPEPVGYKTRRNRNTKNKTRKGKTWADGIEDKLSAVLKIPKVKIVERAGRTIQDILGKPDPWAGQACGRDCWICENTSKEGMKSRQQK